MNKVRPLVLAIGLLLSSTAALAQAPDASDDRATSFHAVTGGEQEDVPGGTLLVAAYGVVLVALIGYVLYVGAIQQGTQREITRLEKLVSARSASAARDGETRDGAPVARPTKD